MRIYYEAIHTTAEATRDRASLWIPKVKLGLLHAPRELTIVPHSWGRTLGPTVFESQKTKGGHFAAHGKWPVSFAYLEHTLTQYIEIPEEVVSDLRQMFGENGPCYRITANKAKL